MNRAENIKPAKANILSTTPFKMISDNCNLSSGYKTPTPTKSIYVPPAQETEVFLLLFLQKKKVVFPRPR
jgi:hypothetical protein